METKITYHIWVKMTDDFGYVELPRVYHSQDEAREDVKTITGPTKEVWVVRRTVTVEFL